LRGEAAGVIIHGLGGVGKSTLAAQLVAALGEQAGLVVSLTGPVAVDQILATIAARLSSWCFAHDIDDRDTRRRLVGELRSGQTPWAERLGLLAEHLLPTLPVTLLLDNAEDNLTPDGPGGGQAFTVAGLGAFLGAWASLPGRAKLLATSRFPLPVDRETTRRLHSHHLGPMSVAEARKLLWRLPALDALAPGQQTRAVTDVGGHPRTLEYLDALLAGGHARFPDVAARLEAALHARGVDNPAAWYATTTGDLDRALAEAVTLAVDDVVLDDLLARLDDIPLARRLLVGASGYRLPVDEVGLAWQVADVVEPAADPVRDAQLAEIARLFAEAQPHGATADEVNLTGEQAELYNSWVAERRRPPLAVPDGFDAAVAALLDVGLLAPTSGTGDETAFTVHRWTATSVLARAGAAQVADAHRRAAAYWQWRVRVWPQDRLADVTENLEAGYHLLTAGDTDGLWSTTHAACAQLHTWGYWDWEEQVCRQTLDRLLPATELAAAFTQQLGGIAYLRGDYTSAEDLYHRSLAVGEELNDRAGIATSYGQLGNIAFQRGDYTGAEDLHRQALAINEELDNRAGIAASYHNLGNIAFQRGDYTGAEDLYRASLAIKEELGDRPGTATSYGKLGNIAQERKDYTAAEAHYRQAIAIAEELGDQAGTATWYQNLGLIALVRGDHSSAENHCRQALLIFEKLGNRASVAISHHNLGVIAQKRRDHAGAENHHRQSLAIKEELGDRLGAATSHRELGAIAQDRGDHAAAEDHYRQALTIFEELGDRTAASCYVDLGEIALARGDHASAEDLYRQFLTIEGKLGDRRSAAEDYGKFAVIARERGATPAPRISTAKPLPSSRSSATGPAWHVATVSSV